MLERASEEPLITGEPLRLHKEKEMSHQPPAILLSANQDTSAETTDIAE